MFTTACKWQESEYFQTKRMIAVHLTPELHLAAEDRIVEHAIATRVETKQSAAQIKAIDTLKPSAIFLLSSRH